MIRTKYKVVVVAFGGVMNGLKFPHSSLQPLTVKYFETNPLLPTQ